MKYFVFILLVVLWGCDTPQYDPLVPVQDTTSEPTPQVLAQMCEDVWSGHVFVMAEEQTRAELDEQITILEHEPLGDIEICAEIELSGAQAEQMHENSALAVRLSDGEVITGVVNDNNSLSGRIEVRYRLDAEQVALLDVGVAYAIDLVHQAEISPDAHAFSRFESVHLYRIGVAEYQYLQP